MKYEFPIITHIDDVLPHIKGKDEFIVAERDEFTIVNYIVTKEDSFDHPILRECRGLIFGLDGKVIARRYHKFFNVGEKEETLPANISMTDPHVILDKLDGSMVTPIPVQFNGKTHYRWGTKMGITSIGMDVEKYVVECPKYDLFVRELDGGQWNAVTPIFEWCSRSNKIVIDHPEDKLVLTAVRYNESGIYMPYSAMKSFAGIYDIPVVEAFDPVVDLDAFVERTRALEDTEGFVVRFLDGHMVKVKCDWYVNLHRIVSSMAKERHIILMILDNKLDDIKPFLNDEQKNRLGDYEKDFWAEIERNRKIIQKTYIRMKDYSSKDRKRFAVYYAPNLEPTMRSMMFSLWDNYESEFSPQDEYIKILRKNLTKDYKFDKIRSILLSNLKDFERII